MENNFEHTEKLLDKAIEILKEANIDKNDWAMGGGTILMLNHNHRTSKDVDIFVDNVQQFNALSPSLNDTADEASYYQTEERFISLTFPEGKIDFIKAHQVTDFKATEKNVFKHSINVEDDVEIVAKKLYFRGNYAIDRDLYDLAVVYTSDRKKDLVKALSKMPDKIDQLQTALKKMPEKISYSIGNPDKLLEKKPIIHGKEIETIQRLCKSVSREIKKQKEHTR